MSGEVQQNLKRALRLLMKPLIKLLIDQGISFNEFAETAKLAYVEMAVRKNIAEESELNRSRVAIMTGLTRKEVSAVINRATNDENHPKATSRPARVLSGWWNDPKYQAPYGMPLEIPYDAPASDPSQPNFTDLVKAYSGDQSPAQMLSELSRFGAVVQLENGLLKTEKAWFAPERISPQMIQRFGEVGYNLLATLAGNVNHTGGGTGVFDTRVFSEVRLSHGEIEQFKEFLLDQGQKFMKATDTQLNLITGKTDVPREWPKFKETGLIAVQYIADEEVMEKDLKELIQEHLQSRTKH